MQKNKSPMPSISRTALVEHSASSMYKLVCDIGAYPEFLPWCSAASVQEQSQEHQLASVTISHYLPQSRFTTRNQLESNTMIKMELVDGPFRYLHGTWRFHALAENACKIELDIDFEFSSAVVAGMISPAFNKVCDSLVNAFIKRADNLLKP